ncbi:MAG: hypothetical protein CSYNP_03609 [Syntrophus sp. SKADARSKE-3]|nr:hypothetical protein [Syntrophus sp. SKADARSKE-3]
MSRVGENIDAHCLKCKLVLAHIVLYEVDGKVSKVKCKTCGAEHKYRGIGGPAKAKEPSERTLKEKKAKAATARDRGNPAPVEWESRRRSMDPETVVKPYRIRDGYVVGDVIEHPQFGLGFVEQVSSEKRIDILFRDAVRAMAMNIPA